MDVDYFSNFPLEITETIFSHLNGVELARCSMVCKTWREICSIDLLWKWICQKEEIPDETLPVDLPFPTEASKKRWKTIYFLNRRRQNRWKTEKTHKWIEPWDDYQVSAADVDGALVVLGTNNGLHLNCLESDEVVPLIQIPTDEPVLQVQILKDSIVFSTKLTVCAYKRKIDKYEKEIALYLNLETNKITMKLAKDSVKPETFLATPSYIWISYIKRNIHIYNRADRTVRVIHHKPEMYNLNKCGESVVVFGLSGYFIYTLTGELIGHNEDNSLHTNYVFNDKGFVAVRSQYFELDTDVVYVNSKDFKPSFYDGDKIYKLTLYKNSKIYISGDESHYTLKRRTDDEIEWTTSIGGSKYIRPGNDLFDVVCSRFLLVSPVGNRLDMYAMYDIRTGEKYFEGNLGKAASSLIMIRDNCLLSSNQHKKPNSIEIRSFA